MKASIIVFQPYSQDLVWRCFQESPQEGSLSEGMADMAVDGDASGDASQGQNRLHMTAPEACTTHQTTPCERVRPLSVQSAVLTSLLLRLILLEAIACNKCSVSAWHSRGNGPTPTFLLCWLVDLTTPLAGGVIQPLSPAELAGLAITAADFDAAVKKVQPSVRREGFATTPDVTWNDVGALSDVRP